MVTFRSDRRFEFEKLKRFELSRRRRFLLLIYFIGVLIILYVTGNLIKYGLCPLTAYWVFYAFYFSALYPAMLIYHSTKPYEITSTGIRINGQLIRWKNFKRIRVEDDYVVLERYIGTPIVLPKDVWSQNGTLSSPISKEVPHHPI